jgi:tripartite-type tricarboxylate transporter receptor subunit TctC
MHGYTPLTAANTHNINGAVYSNLPYHPHKDFAAVASVGVTGDIMMVSAAVPAKTVGEFIQLVRRKTGMVYPSAGRGSATHLSMTMPVNLAGVDILYVPFNSTGDAVLEVLLGRGQAMIGANIAIMAYVNDSRVRLLGVTSAMRSRFFPEVPTLAESGLPGYDFDSWPGLLALVATPRDIVERVNTKVSKLLRNPEVLDRLAKQGIEPRATTVDQMNKRLAADFERMAKGVRIAGAQED